jgi:hypothetical protein
MLIKLGGLCVYMRGEGGDLGWWYVDIVFIFFAI